MEIKITNHARKRFKQRFTSSSGALEKWLAKSVIVYIPPKIRVTHVLKNKYKPNITYKALVGTNCIFVVGNNILFTVYKASKIWRSKRWGLDRRYKTILNLERK